MTDYCTTWRSLRESKAARQQRSWKGGSEVYGGLAVWSISPKKAGEHARALWHQGGGRAKARGRSAPRKRNVQSAECAETRRLWKTGSVWSVLGLETGRQATNAVITRRHPVPGSKRREVPNLRTIALPRSFLRCRRPVAAHERFGHWAHAGVVEVDPAHVGLTHLGGQWPCDG